jgi:hypothetical protein
MSTPVNTEPEELKSKGISEFTVMDFNPVQELNAQYPIVVTLEGIIISVSLGH